MTDVTNLTEYPIGTSALAPLSRNAGDLDKLVNGTGTVENRAGGTLKTWTQLEADFEADTVDALQRYSALNNTGEWVTATEYEPNELWSYDGNWYIVLTAYTSGATGADDIAGGNVQIYPVSGIVWQATSLAQMKSMTPLAEGQVIQLSAGGRSGTFEYLVGDYSAEVAADTLEGVYVALDSDPYGSDGVLKRRLNGYVTPEMFGWDSGELTQETLDSMVSIGIKIDLGNGSFDLVEPLTTTNKNIEIVGSCTFNVLYTSNPSGYTPLTFISEYTDEQSVIANSIVEYDLGAGDTQVSRLTVTDASAYAVNDIVKVISEDLIDGLNPSDTQRNGESHIVGAIDEVNEYIYLSSTLRESYTTTVRVFKYADFKINISGDIKFTGRDGHSGTSRNETILIKGYKKPKVSDISARNITGEFLSFQGCYGQETSNIRGYDLLTDSSKGQVGYVVVERSCGYGIHKNPYGADVRHVYTDGASTNTVSDNPYAYGRNENSDVFDLAGVNCQSAAADTHPGSYGVTFHNPVSRYPYRGTNGALWCVQMRGQNVTAINPTTDGGDAVVIRSEYASENNCKGHRVIGLSRRQKTGETNLTAPVRVLGISGGRASDVKIINPDITMIGDDGPLFECEYADVEIHSPTSTTNITGSSTGNVFSLTDSVVKVFGGHTDLSQSTGANIRYSKLSDSDSEIIFLSHNISRGLADLEYLADFSNANGKAHYIDLKVDSAPNVVNSVNNGGTQDYKISYIEDFGSGRNSGYIETSKTSSFSLSGLNLNRLIDSEISVIIDSSGASGDLTCFSIPIGEKAGQRLRVANKPGATYNITVPTTATNVSLDSDVVISPGRSYTFMSNGTSWEG